MIRRFAVVYEAQADFQIATELADRVLVESIGWMDDEKDLEYQRVWLGDNDGTPLKWRTIKKAALEVGKETALDVLRERGAENGLADSLEEIRERLAPLIRHAP